MYEPEEFIRHSLKRPASYEGEHTAEKIVLAIGHVFLRAKRPKGFRQMAAKQCYRNSFLLASEERAVYCEGFALVRGERPFAFHHAWVSLDNQTAIDVTLRSEKAVSYLGVAFPREVFLTLANRGYGKWGFLRPPFDKNLLGELLGLKT